MRVQLNKPELARFVDEKVRAGEFPNADAVVEDALVRMMADEETLTAQDVAEINASDEEIDRGQFVDFDTFAAETRKKYNIK